MKSFASSTNSPSIGPICKIFRICSLIYVNYCYCKEFIFLKFRLCVVRDNLKIIIWPSFLEIAFVAAHELQDNSNHVVVLPWSINIVRKHVM